MNDPMAFGTEQLNIKKYEKFQIRALKELASESRVRVSLKSYHGAGKTFVAALAAVWFWATRPLAKVIVTAPVEQQVKDHIFGNIATLIRQSNLRDAVEDKLMTMRLEMPGFVEWYIQGRVSNKAVNIEGYHAPHILYIVDEAKGVPYAIFEAIEGALTNEEGDVRVLLISTPSLNPSGYFYDTWKSKKMVGMYRNVNVGPQDSSRVSEKWREERKKDWGEKSPVYQARVLGDFPDAAEGTLIPATMLEPAIDREMPDGKPVGIGADIARFGEDSTVFFIRRGNVLRRGARYNKQDTMTTATQLRMLALSVGAAYINIDDSGLGGGVTDRLRQLKSQFRDPWTINAVDSGSGSSQPSIFQNLKAEMAWALRKRFEEGTISIADDGALHADLLAYKYEWSPGKDLMRLEAKEAMKDRIGHSPDDGDAAMLAMFEPAPKAVPKISFYDEDLDRVVTV